MHIRSIVRFAMGPCCWARGRPIADPSRRHACTRRRYYELSELQPLLFAYLSQLANSSIYEPATSGRSSRRRARSTRIGDSNLGFLRQDNGKVRSRDESIKVSTHVIWPLHRWLNCWKLRSSSFKQEVV